MGSPAKGSGPLAGVRVIDLTAMVMGPYCTQIMADLGADVIKIEPPAGDNTRYISVGPAPGMSGVFANVNRGKRSVVLDLQTDDGRAALRALVQGADVFIHSMRAKAIARLGFAYTDVAALNPAIVYTNCYGYGRSGPDRDLTAYDDTIQAECGLPAIQQQLTGEASFVGTILADKVTGLTALYATMMALFHRARTGEGQEVEVGMFETMASFMLVEHANGAMFSPPLGPAVYPRAVAPNRKPYRTKDGHIAALVYNDKQWAAFVDAVKPAWAGAHYATLAQRARDIDKVYALLAQTFRERTTAEWLELLRALDIPAAPLRTPDELLGNPHLEAVGFFETVDTPHGPGADTAEVLGELGLPCRAAQPASEVVGSTVV
jgi:crotonobetainyl-CoA:carnitine CoA-transferase CaiB-like acyl-CoA transferase